MTNTKVRISEDLDRPQIVRAIGRSGREAWCWQYSDGVTIPVMAGGSGFVGPNPVEHPLGPPVVSGVDITVDLLLNQPTRITQFLMDITLQRFVLDRIFTTPGGVTGGAVVYDVIQGNDLYTQRDVLAVQPGAEFPVISSQRRAPQVAQVEKFGGKYFFTDEARDRNDQVAFQNENIRLGNTIVRKLNSRAVAVLDAAVSGNGGASTFVGHNWANAIPNGSNPTPPAQTPIADFANAQLAADIQELGIQYDTALVNPKELNSLRLFYKGDLEQALSDNGFDEVYASNRIPAGVAYYIASGRLGQMRIEQPLATESWREPETQRTWVQSSVRPVMFVDNPFAVMKATGLES